MESYWRSRMIDAATSDEDKVTPVYKLEEICELLRSSHVSIVKEFSEFILKRLDHKSPVVKQKALRLIKYAVGKSGVEFRREMQRHSVAVRQLSHYKGQLDPLKGDAPNKAVRDTANEAISAIFSADDNKPSPAEDLNRRIQGFGNTNFEMPSEDKKSFLSEVVGLGSASIKQGLSSITQAHSLRKNDSGSYKSPNLRRSLTTEIDHTDRYQPVDEKQGSFGISKSGAGGPWVRDSAISKTETTNGDSSSSYSESKTREERLLETIVISGGVRIQPTRDAIHVFLLEAAKLDELALSLALESKLQSPLWQVRMKAVCVLESMLRKMDDEHFSVVASYFCENKDVVLRCSESPQASLREKANKVLSLLNGEPTGSITSHPAKPEKTTAVQMPDLIDTGEPDEYYGTDESSVKSSDQNIANLTSAAPLIDDLFGESLGTGVSSLDEKTDDDPFADVSFHNSNGREHADDLFSGMTVDDKTSRNGSELFDIFGSNSGLPQEQVSQEEDVHDLMSGLSVNENAPKIKQKGTSPGVLSEFADSNFQGLQGSNGNSILGSSQTVGTGANAAFPMGGSMLYNMPPGIIYNPAFPSQPINYGAMGNLFAQQQLLATMANFQHLGNLSSQNAVGLGHTARANDGGYSSPLPDVFNPNFPTQTPQTPGSMMNSAKKEDTKAFDFISDHLAAARDPKKVV